MGAQAALQLIERYDSFTGSRVLILGGGDLGVRVAAAAVKKGITLAGVVEIDACAARPALDPGIPYYAGCIIEEARGSVEVDSAVIVRLDHERRAIAGSQVELRCDTIVLAIGSVPNVELLDAINCRLAFEPHRGGWVPVRDAGGATSLTSVYAIGDCAGLGADAVEEGRRAAGAIAAALNGAPTSAEAADPAPQFDDRSVQRAREWLRTQVTVSGLDVPVCQCEEVTRRELVDLRPPRYLGAATHGTRDLRALGAEGPLNQDQVKRLTRAGMGPCQGRRCREQIQILIETVGANEPGTVPLARYRPPVRPLPLRVIAADQESAALRDHWVAWFNISTQWLAHWEAKPAPLPAPGHAPVIGESE